MRWIGVFALASALACASTSSSSSPGGSSGAQRSDAQSCPAGQVAAAGWVLLHVLEDRLASETCRWCEPPPFDLSARGALRLQSSDTPATASDVVAYGAVPLAGLGVDFFVSGRDAKTAGVDALIAAETVALAGLAGQAVKLTVARRRPTAYAIGAARASADDDASFYSGHASAAFAVATSFATCASMRGDGDAWVAWAAGLPLAALTASLRIGADRHYLSDVLVGAGAGTLFGTLVPRLLHSPGAAGTPQQREPARLPALTFGGRF